MVFDAIASAKPDAVFDLLEQFNADARPRKVNLTIGIYKDENLRSELFPSVRRAKELVASQELAADYLPIDGLVEMVDLLGPLVFGQWEEASGRIYGAHCVGGTGALCVGAQLLFHEVSPHFYIPHLTWPNHRGVLERIGAKIETYPYYSQEKGGLEFDLMVAALERMPKKSVVLLHPCCHNPTGCDPSLQQWKELSLVMREKELIPFFDCAYQGLGDGIEQDTMAIKTFLQDGHEMLVAYSCSKNFSLYCQRVGVLFAVCPNLEVKERVKSQVKRVIRGLYSNPPAHGARIVAEVLKREDLRSMWQTDLARVRRRLNLMREGLTQRLVAQHKHFAYLRGNKGMFSMLDLSLSQIQELRRKYGIYLLENGRLSLTGLNDKNLDDVANSILKIRGS